MIGQDLFSPRDDRVHDVAVFGDLACGVEISEPSQSLVGLIEVVGFVELVELLERVPRGTETWMSVEQPVEVRLVGVAEMIRAPQEREAGPEQIRFVGRRTLIRGAALYLASYQGEAFGEPARHVKTIEYVKSVG